MKENCKGCKVGKTCSLKNDNDKCPCSKCLIKVICIEMCNGLFDFVIMTSSERKNNERSQE